MPNIAGSFSGTAMSMALFSARDVSNHELQLIEIGGVQKSTDPDWNNARVTYWAMTDGQSGTGTQRGYFNNQHADRMKYGENEVRDFLKSRSRAIVLHDLEDWIVREPHKVTFEA